MFADAENAGWLVAAGTLVVTVSGALGAGIAWWWKTSKEARADAIAEWREITNIQQSDLDRKTLEIRELQKSEARCQIQVAKLEGEIKLLESTIRRLQQITGDDPIGVSTPGLIVSDIQGIIRIASPAIASILHYMPQELRSKPVEVLMPERYKQQYRDALARMSNSQQGPWPERTILGEALTKEGTEVAVAITLSGWKTDKGDWMISAEIKRRQTAPAPQVTVGT